MMKKVLVVNPFGIGDVLMSLSVVAAVKRRHPDCRIDFVGNERTKDILLSCPDLSDIQVFNRDRIREERARNLWNLIAEPNRWIQRWKAARYDIYLDYSLGREFAFMAFMGGVPVRAGFDYKRRGFFLNRKIPLAGYEGKTVAMRQNEVADLAGLSGLTPTPPRLVFPQEASNAAETVLTASLGKGPYLAVAPGGGASWGSDAIFKQWDPDNFSQTISLFRQKRPWPVVLFGDIHESALLERVRARIQGPALLAAGKPLDLAGSLLMRCSAFLGNDGGLAHLAGVLGVPTVAIFGPVDEKTYGPYPTSAHAIPVTANVPCRPCYRSFHFPPCVHERVCLTSLTPAQVLTALEKTV